jgi:hypothetical protein
MGGNLFIGVEILHPLPQSLQGVQNDKKRKAQSLQGVQNDKKNKAQSLRGFRMTKKEGAEPPGN